MLRVDFASEECKDLIREYSSYLKKQDELDIYKLNLCNNVLENPLESVTKDCEELRKVLINFYEQRLEELKIEINKCKYGVGFFNEVFYKSIPGCIEDIPQANRIPLSTNISVQMNSKDFISFYVGNNNVLSTDSFHDVIDKLKEETSLYLRILIVDLYKSARRFSDFKGEEINIRKVLSDILNELEIDESSINTNKLYELLKNELECELMFCVIV